MVREIEAVKVCRILNPNPHILKKNRNLVQATSSNRHFPVWTEAAPCQTATRTQTNCLVKRKAMEVTRMKNSSASSTADSSKREWIGGRQERKRHTLAPAITTRQRTRYVVGAGAREQTTARRSGQPVRSRNGKQVAERETTAGQG